ncbi:MAG: MgtC/SapB family protein [candidate division KSB1 bacterium]|nr:MgtC/SapB family protein [candidate division KSB1 bacterium]
MLIKDILGKFALAMAVGVLIGLQREFAAEQDNKKIIAGIRTFGLLGLLGGMAAMISQIFSSPMPLLVVFSVTGFLIIAGSIVEALRGQIGLTTEVSALLTLLLGSLIFFGYSVAAIAAAVGVAVLLSLKLELQTFVRSLSREDLLAALKFAVITAVILPILPDKSYGPPPFDLFNPYSIWLLVVLISGLSFIGYILIKIIGRKGIVLSGVLGGFVSSTAVTLTMTQKSRSTPQAGAAYAQAVFFSWAIMFLRVIVVSSIVYLPLLARLGPALAAAGVVALTAGFIIGKRQKLQSNGEKPILTNPLELIPALKFAVLFSLVLLLAKAAKIYWGDKGLYAASLLSGLVDVDAVTLSVARLAGESHAALTSAVRAILLACCSNTLLKTGVAVIGGSASFRRAILPGSLLTAALTASLALIL